jgi:peptidoglycan/LPS O-acetylase OafA/YrhL
VDRRAAEPRSRLSDGILLATAEREESNLSANVLTPQTPTTQSSAGAIVTAPPVAKRPPSAAAGRYLALDGLRGVAAAAVVTYHAGVGLKLHWLVPRGYLAVDFFFVLSGFVLARAYGERLANRRVSAVEFLKKRYLRLWPVACAGTALGIALSWPAAERAWSVALAGLFMVPNFWRAGLTTYPYNPPHWSLWHELVANYVYGLLAPRLGTRLLASWIGASAVILTVHVLTAGNADDLWLARVAYSFAVGIALRRVRPAPGGVSVLALSALLVLALCAGGPSRFDLLLILVLLPAIVWAGASSTVGRRAGAVCSMAGRISYPLYACHMPMLLRLIKP